MRLLVPASLFLLAFVVRSIPYVTVFGRDRTYFAGMDAYYHVRRIQHSVAHFPSVLDFDAYVGFPRGGRAIWTPLFDWTLALLALPFGRTGGEAAVERFLVWVPPALGAATVVAVYFLALRCFDRSTALAAALLLCVLSSSFWYAQIGFVDHHVAVALISTLLLAASIRLARTLADPAETGSGWSAAAGTGAALALSLLLWPGSLLHVGLASLGLFGVLLVRPSRDSAARGAALLALTYAVALGLVAPFAIGQAWPQWGDYSPVVLSRFQPCFLGALALLGTACALLWGRLGRGSSGRARAIQAAALGLGLAALAVAGAPELLSSTADSWTWLARRESFQAAVNESMPLLWVQGRWSGAFAELRLSRFIYLFPFAWLLLLRRAREVDDPGLAIVLIWSLGLALATLMQRRFHNSFGVALALLAAWSGVEAYRQLRARWAGSSGRWLAARLGLLATVAYLLLPTVRAYGVPLANLARAWRGEPLARSVPQHLVLRLDAIGTWLRRNTPPTAGYASGGDQPEYGVLSFWAHGHVLRYAAQRPMVIDNFGDDVAPENFELGSRYFATVSEREGNEILAELGVRYVVVPSVAPARGGSSREKSLMQRLYHRSGNGMERHRLLFELPPLTGVADSGYRIFERVAGAGVTGRAPPGRVVAAELEYVTNAGRRGVYRQESTADATGEYRLQLPYSTRGEPPEVRTANAYRLAASGRDAPLEVEERAVQHGIELRGPDLRP